MTETWKPIEGYNGKYIINNVGEVILFWHSPKGKKLSSWIGSDGYRRVDLHDGICRRHKRVTRLVAETFIPNPEGKKDVNHINNNPLDNRVENLEWVTRQENMQWAVKFDRQHVKKCPIIATNKATGEATRFESIAEANRNGFSQFAIWRCLNGQVKSHHGYCFKRA